MNRPQGTPGALHATPAWLENDSTGITEALMRVERLATLPKPCLLALAKAAEIVEHKAGAVIVGRDSQPVALFLLQGRVIVKHSNGTSLRHEANDEPIARPLYRAGEEVEIIAARAVRLLQIPNADYVRQLSLASSMSNDLEFELVDGNPNEMDGLERALRVGALAQVPSEQVQQILLRFEERRVAAGESVYEQGDPGDGFFIVQSGAAEVYRDDAGGKRQRFGVLGPGDTFGEQSLVTGEAREAGVSMLTEGALIRISSEDFKELICQPLVRTVNPDEVSALVDAGGCWLDVRETSTDAIELSRYAVKMPLSTLRAKRGTLSRERPYIVYADDARVETLACFLLAEVGLSSFMLDGAVDEVATAGERTDDVLSDEPLIELEFDGLDAAPGGDSEASRPHVDASQGLEAPMVDINLWVPPDLPVSPADGFVELELTGLGDEARDGETVPLTRASPCELEAVRAAERARYERLLAAQMDELRLVSRRKVKEALNRRRAEMRESVLARMKELRLERQQLLARARAHEAEAAALAEQRGALAAERSAIAKERAALDAERAALSLERAALDRKRLTRKRLAAKRGAGRPAAGTRREGVGAGEDAGA